MAKKKVFVCYDQEKDSAYYNMLEAWCGVDYNFITHTVNLDIDTRTNPRALSNLMNTINSKLIGVEVMVLIVTENTRNLGTRMLLELNLALSLDIPIIAVNVNGLRYIDENNCPSIIKDKHVLHIANYSQIIQKALEIWPTYFKEHEEDENKGARYFNDSLYNSFGLD